MTFMVAGGSVTGRDHVRAGRNNQDAFGWVAAGSRVAAVVCDGCSAGAHSEVGAKLGARIVLDALERHGADWAAVNDALEARLRAIAEIVPVSEYLLFTVVGVLIAGATTHVFHAGDGLAIVNGEVTRLGPYPDNAPPYPAYALMDPAPAFRLRPVLERATAEIDSIVVATDGFDPALADLAEPSSFANPDRIRRRLTLLSRDGHLADDTTVVAIRRRP